MGVGGWKPKGVNQPTFNFVKFNRKMFNGNFQRCNKKKKTFSEKKYFIIKRHLNVDYKIKSSCYLV